MYTEIVRNWMTPNPITITLQTTLAEAQRLMYAHNIRRLPVLHKDRLVGLVTLRDIREAQPSGVTSLSVYGLNYLLDGLIAKEFMAYEPITISPDATIAEAARLMLEHKIGGLPVMEDVKLVGIITETDFCRLLMMRSEVAAPGSLSTMDRWVE